MILIYELVQIKVLHVACKSTGVDEKIPSELLIKQSKRQVNMHIVIGKFEKGTSDLYGYKE